MIGTAAFGDHVERWVIKLDIRGIRGVLVYVGCRVSFLSVVFPVDFLPFLFVFLVFLVFVT